MSTVNAVRVEKTGGPEVLKLGPIEIPPPGPGEVRLRQTAIGLNFVDTYYRSGLYKTELPTGLGAEAAGVVESLGEGVTDLAVGDRVAYATAPIGAYVAARNVAAAVLVKLPDDVSDRVAAASTLKGLTAQYLVNGTYPVKRGDVVLVHAAAGGVGLLLCQWAKHLGATVIGTVGSEAKVSLAREHGCDHVLLYRSEDVAARVREITHGAGVPVVYDSVGKDTFKVSLDCLRPRGLLVSFGNASGAVEGVALGILAQKGSLYLTRPTLRDYARTREELVANANDLFAKIASGVLRVRVHRAYPLADAAAAHRDLESRKTTGSSVLVP